MSYDPAPLFDGFENFDFGWLYVMLNDYAVGKYGIAGDDRNLRRRLSAHAKVAKMSEVILHRTPTPRQLEAALDAALAEWRLAGREWIDFGYPLPAKILCDLLDADGADTSRFREVLSRIRRDER